MVYELFSSVSFSSKSVRLAVRLDLGNCHFVLRAPDLLQISSFQLLFFQFKVRVTRFGELTIRSPNPQFLFIKY
jgi:hypothetical protein